MAAYVSFALAVVMCVAAASDARAQTTAPLWKPDEATVKSIEATLAFPSSAPWAPGRLDS